MPNAENAAAAVATRSWRETPPADASQVVVAPPSGETAAQDASSIILFRFPRYGISFGFWVG